MLTLDQALDVLRTASNDDRINTELDAAEGIVRSCEFSPLALRIVAAHLKTDPRIRLADVVDQLKHEKEYLPPAVGQVVPERAAVSWSYQTLPAQAQHVFRLLGLYAGTDIGYHGAGALCNLETANLKQFFAILLDRNLVERNADYRYHMHDQVRAYAKGLAEHEETAHERNAALGRILSWFAATSYVAEQICNSGSKAIRIVRPRPDIRVQQFNSSNEALAWFTQESVNLKSLARMAFDIGDFQTAIDSVLNWQYFLEAERQWTTWLACNVTALEAARSAGDSRGAGWILVGTGTVLRYLGRTAEAAKSYQQAVELLEEAEDVLGAGYASRNLATTQTDQKLLEQAVPNYIKALQNFRQIGDKHGEVTTLTNLAEASCQMGRFADAIDYAEQGVFIREDMVESETRMGLLLRILGHAHAGLGRNDEALTYLGQALEINRHSRQQYEIAQTLTALGDIRDSLGHVEQAQAAWHEAWTIYTGIQAPAAAQILEKMQS